MCTNDYILSIDCATTEELHRMLLKTTYTDYYIACVMAELTKRGEQC
jgi:hypothetical protein